MATTQEYLTKLQEDKQNIITGLQNIGVNIGDNAKFSDVVPIVPTLSISGGGGEPEHHYTGTVDAEGLRQIGWSEEDIQFFQDNVFWDEENDDLYKLTENEKTIMSDRYSRYINKNTSETSFANYCSLIVMPSFVVRSNTSFQNASALRLANNLDTSNITSLSGKFNNCYSLKKVFFTDTKNIVNMANLFSYCYSLKEMPDLDTSSCTDMSSMFSNCYSLQNIKNIDTSKVTLFTQAFGNCYSLKEMPNLDFSSATSMSATFTYCYSLEKVPDINASNCTMMSGLFSYCYSLKTVGNIYSNSCTNFSSMFSNCRSLIKISSIDTSNGTSFSGMFSNCYSLMELPELNTSNATSISSMFNSCYKITDLPELDLSKCVNVADAFKYCVSLINIGGFKDLGKAYLTTASANYSNYTLNLQINNNITHDSLMNVINNLYDIKSAGVQPQKLVLGYANLNKLTAEEKAIATNKGWVLS